MTTIRCSDWRAPYTPLSAATATVGELHEGNPMTQPTVGRIVHYTSYGTPGGEYTSQCRAAVITEVGHDDTVGLAVLNPSGLFFDRAIPKDKDLSDGGPAGQGGTWHWPCVQG